MIKIIQGRVDSDGGQPNEWVNWHDEMMREAQAWKTDIMDNRYSGTSTPSACDLPMMILVNKKENSEAAAAESDIQQEHGDLEHQGETTRAEQLVDLATNNGFSSW